MSLRPAALLGLPATDPLLGQAALRDALFLSCLLWSWLALRRRSLLAGVVGALHALAAAGFWVLSLGRPYGLFLEPRLTRWAAEVAVVRATGRAAEGVLAGTPGPAAWALLPGVPERLALLLPSFLPALALPAVAGLLLVLWAPREKRGLAALLWIGFSTGDLEALRGVGFLSGIWSHPAATLALLVVVTAVLALARPGRGRAGVPLGLAALSLWLFVPVSGHAPGPADTVLLLTLDQGAWLFLALGGLRLGTDPAARALLTGGALLSLAAGLGAPVEPWGAHALYRLGLLLASTTPLDVAARRLAPKLGALRPIGRIEAGPLALGLAALLLIPPSFLDWWTPKAPLDPIAEASREPLSPNVGEVMRWIRERTPPGAVFVASPAYAPEVAVRGGRRVLRAPTLFGPAADESRRLRAEKQVLRGGGTGRLARLYGLRYVLAAPGDFREYGIEWPGDLATRRWLSLRLASPAGLSVFEIAAPPGSAP